jgi:S1-C subfamily serine protease
VNIRGEIIGVNVAIYRGDENVRAWQGVGLAVPANDAKSVVDAIIAQSKGGGQTPQGVGYLGLELSSDAVAIDARLGTSRVGAFVTDLDPSSPALAAGIVPGDVITALNGRPFGTPRELLAAIRQLVPGQQANLTVFRDGRLVEVPVMVGQRPDAP